MQYGAPGTEFSGYGDGVAVGETPLDLCKSVRSVKLQARWLLQEEPGMEQHFGRKNYRHVSTISISCKKYS
jgi:hypothetical protein